MKITVESTTEIEDPFKGAECEALAQLEIIRALGKLPQARRAPVFEAVRHLLAAEELVPGIMAMIRNEGFDPL